MLATAYPVDTADDWTPPRTLKQAFVSGHWPETDHSFSMAEARFLQESPEFGLLSIPLRSLHPEVQAMRFCTDSETEAPRDPRLVACCKTPEYLFGAIEIPSENIETSTATAYQNLLSVLSEHPRYRLLRVWHYFPQINRIDGDLERYQLFSRARYDMLSTSGYQMSSDLPAASAVGSDEGHLVIHFLAGTGAVRAIENPRQTSAYCYPSQYGPRSPSFTRAIYHQGSNYSHLFLSGTASIVGHHTVAPLDRVKQTHETLLNLDALLTAADFPGIESPRLNATWCVYIRNAEDLPYIRDIIEAKLHNPSSIVYLRGDLCRKDLVVEIEGFLTQDPEHSPE